jgi:hypothetical protein
MLNFIQDVDKTETKKKKEIGKERTWAAAH